MARDPGLVSGQLNGIMGGRRNRAADVVIIATLAALFLILTCGSDDGPSGVRTDVNTESRN